MKRKIMRAGASGVRLLVFCFVPVAVVVTALGTIMFWLRARFMSAETARAYALRFDLTAEQLTVKRPLRSCVLYKRAIIAARRTGDQALEVRTLVFAARHFFACGWYRSARRSARRAVYLIVGHCRRNLDKVGVFLQEHDDLDSMCLIIRCSHWMLISGEARRYEQQAQLSVADGKYYIAADTFRFAAETAKSEGGGDFLEIALLRNRQAEALIVNKHFAKAVRILRTADAFASEWVHESDPIRLAIANNLAVARNAIAAEEAEERRRTGWTDWRDWNDGRTDPGVSG